MSPVASFGFSVPASRFVTFPVTRRTNSLRTSLADLVGVGRFRGVDDDLRQAVAVAQVDEDQLPEIAPAVDPAGQGHLGASVLRPKLAAGVRAIGSGQARFVQSVGAHRRRIVVERCERTSRTLRRALGFRRQRLKWIPVTTSIHAKQSRTGSYGMTHVSRRLAIFTTGVLSAMVMTILTAGSAAAGSSPSRSARSSAIHASSSTAPRPMPDDQIRHPRWVRHPTRP